MGATIVFKELGLNVSKLTGERRLIPGLAYLLLVIPVIVLVTILTWKHAVKTEPDITDVDTVLANPAWSLYTEKAQKYYTRDQFLDVTSYEDRSLVGEGWNSMAPESPEKDYIWAYNMNIKAWQLGHGEGASNIGLLHENGWGFPKDLNLAAAWYIRAMEHNAHHSAQAELGLARTILENPSIASAGYSVQELIERAKVQAHHPEWAEIKEQMLKEAESINKRQN